MQLIQLQENYNMQTNNLSAHALSVNKMEGNVRSIEARTEGGKALTSLVRMSVEYALCVDDGLRDAIEDRFQAFVLDVEGLL